MPTVAGVDEPILHLSLPVRGLGEARRFYEDVLGCRVGRVRDDWFDVWFFGMQLTLQHQPDEVVPADEQGMRHFGVALSPAAYDDLVARVEACGAAWLSPPTRHTEAELSGKRGAKLADPSGNVIELKSYAHPGDLSA